MPYKRFLLISSLVLICLIIAVGFIFKDTFLKKESQVFKKMPTAKNLLNAALSLNWSQTSTNNIWAARREHAVLNFNNKIWILGGVTGNSTFFNDVWYSSDGITWTQATANAGWAARKNFAATVFNNKMWIMGGYGGNYRNDVWYSSDGITWTQATAGAQWPGRSGLNVLAFNNKLWVMGGYNVSDVWYSSNGITWTQATANAGWPNRFEGTAFVFNNKMWVAGGWRTGTTYNGDVWYSSDGITWTQATASAGWSARHYLVSTVLNNNIFIMGGKDPYNQKSDVWYSSDGVNWTLIGDAGWSYRYGHAGTIFNNKIWVLGGASGGTWKNDVWSTSLPVPTIDLTVDQTTIAYNSSATLTWTSTNADSCSASSGWSGAKSVSNSSETINNLLKMTVFYIDCFGPGGTIYDSVAVIVSPPNYIFNSITCLFAPNWPQIVVIDNIPHTCSQTRRYCNNETAQQGIGQCCANYPYSDCEAIVPAPSVDLKVNNSNGPISVANNSSATLSWISSGAASCAASDDWSGSKEKFSLGESMSNLTSSKTYTLTCINPSGSISDSVTVNTSCAENWSCGAWSICANGQQTRTCTDANNCSSIVNKPAITQNCVGCSESWSCGNWSNCSNGQHIRTCTDANTCDTTNNKPETTGTCCSENWSCSEWSNCANGQKIRTCSDSNSCSTTTDKPTTSQSCNAVCAENWICNTWSTCNNNQQTRTCADANICGTTTNKPAITQSCSNSGGQISGISEGALIRAIGNVDVWIIKYMGSKRFKRLILSPSVFNSYGHLKWSDIKDTDKSTVDLFTTSELVRAAEAGDVKTYKLYPAGDIGEKRWIKTEAAFTRMGQDWDAVYTINETDRDSYVTGQTEE